MGLSELIKFITDLALGVFDACGLIVFVTWAIVRTIREVRGIVRGGGP